MPSCHRELTRHTPARSANASFYASPYTHMHICRYWSDGRVRGNPQKALRRRERERKYLTMTWNGTCFFVSQGSYLFSGMYDPLCWRKHHHPDIKLSYFCSPSHNGSTYTPLSLPHSLPRSSGGLREEPPKTSQTKHSGKGNVQLNQVDFIVQYFGSNFVMFVLNND